MKRIVALFIAAALALTLLAGCGAQKNDAEKPAETVTETVWESRTHTVAPSDFGSQTEWVPVDSELSLEDKTSIYAQKKDFLMFAVVGSTDEDCALVFRVDEATAEMLAELESAEGLFLKLDGEMIGSVTLNETFDELTLAGVHTYRELCALATRIRGLE